MSTNVLLTGGCPYCSTQWSAQIHPLGSCPNVEAIEYHPDGRIARVVFRRQKWEPTVTTGDMKITITPEPEVTP